jgi:ribonuclease HII
MLPLYQSEEGVLVCGCDEAGRGCLAGPVVAAAVILPNDFEHHLLNDSKQLSLNHRRELREYIMSRAMHYAIGVVDNITIDRINILQASFLAMHRAIEQLPQSPGLILVDGNRFKPYGKIPHQCVVRGDGKYSQIAAASVLAKTTRDDMMEQLHQQYPGYSWANNKGYPSVSHRDAIRSIGPTPYHRMSFNLLGSSQIAMF